MSFLQSSAFCILFLFISSACVPLTMSAQSSMPSKVYFGIEKVFPSFSLSRAELEEAQTLSDLNERFESDWVSEYYSVEIETIQDGKAVVTQGKNDKLTKEQQSMLASADPGSKFNVVVKYLPQNSLKVKEEKVLDFRCFVEPESSAKFGSELSVEQYLHNQLKSKVPESTLEGYDLGIYRFTIDASGNSINPSVFSTSGSEWLDALCLEVICDFPKWKPAQYQSGLKISEEKVLLVGNTQNCMIHTLNLEDSAFAHPTVKE